MSLVHGIFLFLACFLLMSRRVELAGYSFSPSCSSGQIPAVIRAVGVPVPNGDIVPGNGNSPPTGFFVELLDAIRQKTGIPYVLSLRADYQIYNGLDFNGTVLQSLMNNEADLAISLSSITLAGSMAVDYLQTVQDDSVKVELLYNSMFGLNNATQYLVSPQFGDLDYFQGSTNQSLVAIYNNIVKGSPGSLTSSDDDAIAKVLSGNFAYIADSPFRDQFVAQHPNDLTAAPGYFGVRYCALAVRLGSPLRKLLDLVLQEFVEDGTLATLSVKYPNQSC